MAQGDIFLFPQGKPQPDSPLGCSNLHLLKIRHKSKRPAAAQIGTVQPRDGGQFQLHPLPGLAHLWGCCLSPHFVFLSPFLSSPRPEKPLYWPNPASAGVTYVHLSAAQLSKHCCLYWPSAPCTHLQQHWTNTNGLCQPSTLIGLRVA